MADDMFREVAALIAAIDDPRTRIVDARSVPHGPTAMIPGAERYAAGHIPGAVYLNYASDLSDPATPYAARVAPPELFAQRMSAAGIGDESIVYAYDEADIPFAARVVWMLRYYGHDAAFVLAGGIKAWLEAGRTLSADAVELAPAVFTPRPHAAMRASLEEVIAITSGAADAQLLETQREPMWAKRTAMLPRAVRLSGNDVLDDARGGRVADHARLRATITALGLDPNRRTVVSCGSGVNAAGAWIALRDIGFRDVAVYDGSWVEWEHRGLPTVPKHDSVRPA